MKPNYEIEEEIDRIRLEIYEETKNMTYEQQKERLNKIAEEAQREFGFIRITSADDPRHPYNKNRPQASGGRGIRQ